MNNLTKEPRFHGTVSEQSHKTMSRIKGKDTTPELVLRKALWQKGVRYRKNLKGIPGRPDIVITKYKIAIFVDSEFFRGKDWNNKKKESIQRGSNGDYWSAKIERNIERDREKRRYMSLRKEDVIDLYESYNFECGNGTDDYLVFFNQRGYFQNAEIVRLNNDCVIDDKVKSEYEDIGYSVRIRCYETLEDAHEALFSGFFNVAQTNKRLGNEYKDFCIKQSKALTDIKYEYIPGNYIEDGSSSSNENVVERIKEIFGIDNRQLIILEASAGYGKTCTSYEVINKLIAEYPKKIPLMAELSKNRSAPVFRYVLLSEIDQKFPALSSALVTKEIMSGRILLIIDGFDELLSKTAINTTEPDKMGDEAQTMLDTIAELIPPETKTKILLTTRNSSMLVGEEFDIWVQSRLKDCPVTRIQLEEPNAHNWLGEEKLEILKRKNIVINNILNPVLLASLRSESLEDINTLYDSNNDIVEHFLYLLLSRERIRQSLRLEVSEQREIMSKLSALMVQNDFSAEDIDFINICLIEITGVNIEDYIGRYKNAFEYNAEEKVPNADEFINKLSHHALLDRISDSKNQVGFVNQYIFGLMIAEAVMKKYLPVNDLKGKYLDIAVSSFSSYGKESRLVFYNVIKSAIENTSCQNKLKYEIDLINTVETKFKNAYFERVIFKRGTEINKENTFENCSFFDCTFRRCVIKPSSFIGCQFYNCTFYNVEVIEEQRMCGLMFFSCSGHEEFEKEANKLFEEKDSTVNYERIVLEQYWRPGAERADIHRGYQTLFRGVSKENRQFVSDAVESLIHRNILIKNKGQKTIILNKEMLDEIKMILGR